MTIDQMEILKAMFGGDRYARDYEYLDKQYGHLAVRLDEYIKKHFIRNAV